MRKEPNVTYTLTTKEIPVISYNDMAFISERNSIVFRAGDSPIWNRNEFILPMSWRLFSNTIVHAGHDYSLQTIPTLSSALDFDIRKNQPDFQKMLDKRIVQAYYSEMARKQYVDAYYGGRDDADYQIGQLDPDVYSDEIMAIVDEYTGLKLGTTKLDDNDEYGEYGDDYYDDDVPQTPKRPLDMLPDVEENTEQIEANRRAEEEAEQYSRKLYAGKSISRENLVSRAGQATHSVDRELRATYIDIKHSMERDTTNFMVVGGNLCGKDGEPYVLKPNNSKSLKELNEAIHDNNSRVFSDKDLSAEDLTTYHFTDAFYRFLIEKDSWQHIAHGEFEARMKREMLMMENLTRN